MKTRIAAIAAAAVLVVGGGTAYALSTTGQEPAPVETTAASTPTPAASEPADAAPAAPSADTTPTPEPTADYITTNDDAGYLAEVEKRTPPQTVLDQFTDAELIALGHEGCKQIDAGVKFEDLRLVEGETPSAGGYYLDTSAVFNSALLNYCQQLMTIPPAK
ncbi:hypothetical protein WDU99_01870 [Microbacterium sp. Mu-80]|uniref:DUF732 domain-containing protein n=1 Tax=Microbacterium bandirmense TaxID=3122050 RepID=A0ABU8L7M3_9MICO